MSTSLLNSIVYMFSQHQLHPSLDYGNMPNANPSIRYMEIPMKEAVFDVPMFILPRFLETVNNGFNVGKEVMVVPVRYKGSKSRFKSLERIMQDTLVATYKANVDALVSIPVTQKDEELMYYGTAGSVFDKDLNPLMLACWQFKKTLESSRLEAVKPVIWISPKIYHHRTDKMPKLILDKVLPTILSTSIVSPINAALMPSSGAKQAKVIVDDCPFNFQHTTAPSADISNTDLLKVAADYIDDIMMQ